MTNRRVHNQTARHNLAAALWRMSRAAIRDGRSGALDWGRRKCREARERAAYARAWAVTK